MFDSVIFAPWPRGVYLAKKLSDEGRKVAYIEILPRSQNPFGLFLNENSQSEKEFLETLGFLFRQEGGFCLISPEGVWPLQEMNEMRDRHFVLKNTLTEDSFKNFQEHWFSYLSLNMTAKVFEYNNSRFSNKNLNLFSDYFLFENSFKKIEQFKKNNPKISFFEVFPEEIVFEEKQKKFFIQNKHLESDKFFWLGGNHFPTLKNKKTSEAYWEWEAFFFKVDFEDYKEIIPSHFVSLKDLFLPWSHHNMLSVFHKDGCLEAWFKRPYKKNKESILKEVQEHLESLFPFCNFFSN